MDLTAELKNLWRSCFDDTDEYIELFFERCYRPEGCVFVTAEERVAAALYILPRKMTFDGRVVDIGYIYGVATHPDYRKRGFMRRIMGEAHARMQQQGIALSTLIPAEPWLWSCYEKMGYRSVFYSSTEVYVADKGDVLPCLRVEEMRGFSCSAYDFFNKEMMRRGCCVQHDAADFDMLATDISRSGGGVWTAYTGQCIEAVAFCLPCNDGRLVIREGCYASPLVRKALLHAVCNCYGVGQVYSLVRDDGTGKPLGMACPLDDSFDFDRFVACKPTMSLMLDE